MKNNKKINPVSQIRKTTFSAMGTECNLYFYDTPGIDTDYIAELVISEVERIEAKYSRYRTDSFLNKINEVALQGGKIDVDDETASLLDYANACYNVSEGLFDISTGILRKIWNFNENKVPLIEEVTEVLQRIGMDKITWQKPKLMFTVKNMEIDFGGIGKEYAVDRAEAISRANGILYGLIDLGGDIRAVGAPEEHPWEVCIRNPRLLSEPIVKIKINKGGLATSGDYERFFEIDGKRYSHILNPKTGFPADGLQSVSVLSEQCLLAGSLSTMAMLKGHQGVEWLKSLGVPYFCVDSGGNQHSSGVTFVLSDKSQNISP